MAGGDGTDVGMPTSPWTIQAGRQTLRFKTRQSPPSTQPGAEPLGRGPPKIQPSEAISPPKNLGASRQNSYPGLRPAPPPRRLKEPWDHAFGLGGPSSTQTAKWLGSTGTKKIRWAAEKVSVPDLRFRGGSHLFNSELEKKPFWKQRRLTQSLLREKEFSSSSVALETF